MEVAAKCVSRQKIPSGLYSYGFTFESYANNLSKSPSFSLSTQEDNFRARWFVKLEEENHTQQVKSIQLLETSMRIQANIIFKNTYRKFVNFIATTLQPPFEEHDVSIQTRNLEITFFVQIITDPLDGFEQLLNNAKLTDVKILVGEKCVQAHKNVLIARNPVFYKLITEKLVGGTDIIEITDVEYKINAC